MSFCRSASSTSSKTSSICSSVCFNDSTTCITSLTAWLMAEPSVRGTRGAWFGGLKSGARWNDGSRRDGWCADAGLSSGPATGDSTGARASRHPAAVLARRVCRAGAGRDRGHGRRDDHGGVSRRPNFLAVRAGRFRRCSSGGHMTNRKWRAAGKSKVLIVKTGFMPEALCRRQIIFSRTAPARR